MPRSVFVTRVETPEEEGAMRRVTSEYFADKGYTPSELRQINRLNINELWQAPGRGCERSIRRVS